MRRKRWRRSDRETRVVGAAPRGSGCCCGRHPTAGPVDRWAITGRRTVRPAPTDAALLAYQFPIGGQGTVGQAIFPRQLTNTLFAISSGGAGDEASPDRRVDRGRGPPRLGAGHRRTAGDSRTCACRPVPTVAEAQAAIAAPSRPVGRPMPDPASPARRTFNRANSAAGGRTHRRIHRFNQMSSANHLQ